jgi:hypothetical protein
MNESLPDIALYGILFVVSIVKINTQSKIVITVVTFNTFPHFLRIIIVVDLSEY